MSIIPASVIRSLESLLRRECKLYQQYIEILIEERTFLTKFDADKLNALTAKRSALYDDMLVAQDERLAIMRTFPNPQGFKLRELISQHCSKADQQLLMPLAEQLRNFVQSAQQASREQSQIVKFGLKLVHGVLSLFWSATQNVVKTYGRKGDAKENFNSSTRENNLLKRA